MASPSSNPDTVAWLKELYAQIEAVYSLNGGEPESVVFATQSAKELSISYINRFHSNQRVSVHAKRQMALCLTALEQGKDAAVKAFTMPEPNPLLGPHVYRAAAPRTKITFNRPVSAKVAQQIQEREDAVGHLDPDIDLDGNELHSKKC
jgi:hypothetical protein